MHHLDLLGVIFIVQLMVKVRLDVMELTQVSYGGAHIELYILEPLFEKGHSFCLIAKTDTPLMAAC